MKRLRTRRRSIRKRAKKSGCDTSKLVTVYELFRLCADNNYKCAVTGNAVYFHPPSDVHLPYWALSLDHINPFRKTKYNPNSWSKDNLQLLSAVLNSIKGHVPNEELVRWYNDLMRSKATPSTTVNKIPVVAQK